jgi:Short C-terminal domain
MNVGHDENSVIFLRSQMPDFEKLRTAVETAIAQNAKPQGRQHTASIPEQIAQLAALRDQSILTDEEFAAKKSSLLSQI